VLSFVRAIFLHGIQVLLLRHDGKGLPESKGAIYSILAVAIIAGAGSDALLYNDFLTAILMAVFGLVGTIAIAYAYPWMVAPIACALIVTQSCSILLILADVGSFLPKLVGAWGAVASLVYFFRNVKR
jgi:hypothetical protein